MKVHEVIEKLKKCPPDLEVDISADEGCEAVLQYTYPGLYSCIQLISKSHLEMIKSLNSECYKIIE